MTDRDAGGPLAPPVPNGPESSRLASAEARLAQTSPGYLHLVRESARRLSAGAAASSAAAAVEAVEQLSSIDTDVPAASRLPGGRYLKAALKRLLSWYLGYVARQVTVLGLGVARLGSLLLERVEAAESSATALEAEVAALAARVDRLEGTARGRG